VPGEGEHDVDGQPIRSLADNSAGMVIENLLRNDIILVDEVGFAPLDDTAAPARNTRQAPVPVGRQGVSS